MEDTALVTEMLKCTAKLFIGMKRNQMEIKSFLHGEMFILDILERRKGAVLPGELSMIMEASSASVAIALRNLEKKGYIERNIDKSDRRKVLVTITGNGRDIVKKQHKIMEDKMRHIIDSLGEKDAREYIRIVGKIIDITHR